MSDPKEIFLQPECCADPSVGRLWCEHDAPVDCEDGKPWTRYVLAPITDEWLAQNPDYTCCCGIYVHPSKRNPAAIHIPDCQFATVKP